MVARVANQYKFIFLNILLYFPSSGSLPSRDGVVTDNLFTTGEILGMKKLLSSEETIWSFAGTETSDETSAVTSCHSWSSQPTPSSFMKLSAWSKLANICLNVSGWRATPDRFCSVLATEGEINIKTNHICSKQLACKLTLNNTDNCFVAVIFLVEEWNRNSYGELVVYDKGEILKAVHPKPGRLVIFPARLEHIIKPPAIDYSGRLYAMKVYLSVLDKRRQIPHELSKDDNHVFQQKLWPSFKLLSKANDLSKEDVQVDVKKFITRNFTTRDGRSIVVFDDLIPVKDLNALMHTVRSSGYTDDAASKNSEDNVQWIMAFEVEEFVQTLMWQLFSQIVTAVTGKQGYYPYDIGCNNIQSSDTPTIHRDCAPHENEFTLLVYLNENWTKNHHGETVFFTDMEGSEVIFAVRPKYGRVTIFHGTIPHSARPPPLTFAGARFSFAVKMSPSKEIADKKALTLDLDVLYELLATLQGAEERKLRNIIRDINDGKVDQETIQNILAEYERRLL
ncbi:uncharacterized protein [Montipora foliosa]|uniref:uncharacterized protein isoform X1 n=1 Tax=Montipora foliosa TaxID=591990 RepID=UPI0035F109DE